MPAVFIVRDRITGEEIIGPTTRLTRSTGRQRITVAPGSFVIPIETVEPGEEIFFYITFPLGMETRSPTITRNGRTLSWPSLQSMSTGVVPNPNVVDFDIVYGVY